MLYTFSQADYNENELLSYLSRCSCQDALVCWQDAVLLPIKYPHLWQNLPASCYVLQTDLQARQLEQVFSLLNTNIQPISLNEFVDLTEQYFPQIAL